MPPIAITLSRQINMNTIEYLQVQRNRNEQFFQLIAILEETVNEHISHCSVRLIPLTRTSISLETPYTSKHTTFPSQPYFDLKLDHRNKTATFATRCDVIIPEELRGFGLGSYAFSRLIEWGKTQQPSYRVGKLRLANTDAQTDEARDRRNRFYRKHGFEFEFYDPDFKTGFCFSDSVANLRPEINPDKVSVLDLFTEMQNLIISKEKLTKENAQRKLAFENCNSRNRKLIIEKGRLWLLLVVIAIIACAVLYSTIN